MLQIFYCIVTKIIFIEIYKQLNYECFNCFQIVTKLSSCLKLYIPMQNEVVHGN